MKFVVIHSIIPGIGVASLLAGSAGAADLRFDVSTSNNAVLLPNLSFRSANGHINLVGGSTYKSLIESKGNAAGIYYNNFNTGSPFTAYPNPHDMAVAIQSYVNTYWSAGQDGWIALNEISPSNWQNNPVNADGIDYRTWCADVVGLLKNGDSSDPSNIVPAHTGVIIWAPFGTPSGNTSSWRAITQNAYIGDERYINGATVQADGYSVSTVQNFYQQSYNAWVNSAGVPANRLILSEEYTNSTAGNGYGANGLSGEAWQAAIEARALAAYNVGFAGYVGYAWDKNAQGSPNSALVSYTNAYASTMVLQNEVPCWTGNNSSVTGNTWADYLNWTGGLPSTTQFPYDPLLNNPNNAMVIQHQTAANFFSNANTSAGGATITLDGDQSITNMTFDSANPYTVAPGTGGSLTITGSNPSITVNSGSHSITSDVDLNNNLAINLTGNLTISGGLTNAHVITKSGTGILTISGTQSNLSGAALSISAGTLNLNSDAGSSNSLTLAFSSSGGTTNLNSTQHFSSLSITGGSMTLAGQNRALVTKSILVGNAGTLDLTQNSMIVSYSGTSPINDIAGYLKSGYTGGAWNGPGINSSTAAGNSARTTALGYAEASDLGYSVFAGQPINGDAVLVQYTFYGDANLDGTVNALDFNALATHYGQTPGNEVWAQGDFNYDGTVNSQDFAVLAANYGEVMPSSSVVPLGSVVPEPLGIALSIPGMMLIRRRSRKLIGDF